MDDNHKLGTGSRQLSSLEARPEANATPHPLIKAERTAPLAAGLNGAPAGATETVRQRLRHRGAVLWGVGKGVFANIGSHGSAGVRG